MKRICLTLLLLAFLTLISVFVSSCGKSETPKAVETAEETTILETRDESEAEPESLTGVEDTRKEASSVDPSSFYFYKEFGLPSDFRQAAVDYMRAQSQMTWTAGETFRVKQDFELWSTDMTYKKGTVYSGIPYSNRSCTADEFFMTVDENNVYHQKDCNLDDVMGNGCASSVMLSYEQFSKIGGYSSVFDPASKDYKAIPVGDYSFEKGQESKEIIKQNGLKTMYASYALAQKGDVMYRGPSAAAHVRMIVESHVEYKSDGSINGRKSWISVIEQTNQIEQDPVTQAFSSWRVDKRYSFEDLFADGYVVSTLPEYETGVSDIPYIALKNEIKAEDLSDQALLGIIESSRVIHFVFADLYSTDGKLVKRFIIDHRYTGMKIELRKYSYDFFKDLEPGGYTLVLTAGIASGKAELAKVDFTYNK